MSGVYVAGTGLISGGSSSSTQNISIVVDVEQITKNKQDIISINTDIALINESINNLLWLIINNTHNSLKDAWIGTVSFNAGWSSLRIWQMT